MGYKIVRQMRERKLPAGEMAVWTALGDHARDLDGGGAFPSQETLARETGYTARQIRTILRRLEARGAIVETRRPGRRTSREYRIVLAAAPLLSETRPEKISGLNHAKAAPDSIKTGNPCTQDRKSFPLRPEKISAKPSLIPKEPSETAHARARESRDVAPSPARESMDGPDNPKQKEPRERLRSLSKERNEMFKTGLYSFEELIAFKHLTLEELKQVRAEREKQQTQVNRAEGTTKVISQKQKYAKL